jgi:rfaE bifunctional protein nucleotidyltransferase chain/domain
MKAKENFQDYSLRKRIAPQDLKQKVEELKKEGKTIATLNGSFDLMHAGHLQIIYEASLMADVLIVALNSDNSIKGYKSKDRPIIELEYRLQMMTALGFVTFVTWFDELNPLEFLKKVIPHVHVNGADWGKDCIEASLIKEQNAQLHIANFVEGLSTTQIIKKIKQLCD